MPYDIKDMQERARLYGGKCFSKEYVNSFTPLKWMCKKGHTWDAPYSIIRQGGWCVVCAKAEDKRLRLEKIKGIAAKKGGKCLSVEYKDSKAHLNFQCALSHRWQTAPGNILGGSWCPKCAGKAKPSFAELHQLAASKGGKLLSKKYINNYSSLKWQCKKGHQWMAGYSNVQFHDSWCPSCYGNVPKTINMVRQLAREKGGKCLSESYTNNREKLKFECAKGHIWTACTHNIITQGSWCPYCAGKAKRTIQQMQALAKKHQGKCLSADYITSKIKLKWQCKKKHIWMTAPDNVVAGHWCPECAFLEKRKKTTATLSFHSILS